MTEQSAAWFQVAWVVNDLQASVKRWLATANVGPFFVVPHAKVEGVLYRGAPAELDFSAALVQAGPIQIELIEQHNDGPSAYRDVFPRGQEGFHHMAVMTNRFDIEMEKFKSLDCAAVTEGYFGDMRYAYVDTRARLGHMTELVEERESIKGIFKLVAEASVGWNGANPIRYL